MKRLGKFIIFACLISFITPKTSRMKRCRIHILSVLLICLSCPALLYAATEHAVSIEKLKVEYAEMPLGIDVEKPRFSWQMVMQNTERGYSQKAYQITVTDEAGQTVWDSGRVSSDLSLNIEYAGAPLQPTTCYFWTVNVWNQKGEQSSSTSWFETGLMSKANPYEGWSDAKWIGGGDEDMVLYSHYLPVFRLNVALRLDKETKSTRAGFVYGANDKRLMDKNKNLYQLQNGKDESYIKIELDLDSLTSGKKAMLNVYRVGYHPDDRKDVPFKSFPIPLTLINESNKYDRHTVSLTSDLGFTRFYVDNAEELGWINLNPLGQGGDFIAFPVVGDIGFDVPAGQSATFPEMEIANFRSPSNVIATCREGNSRIAGGTSGVLTIFTPEGNSAPMLRTVFSSHDAEIVKARLYVTSRGIYEVYLNGKRVGDDYFNPGVTQYNKTHLYQTFDVTKYVHSGRNALGALLAEGWWSGGATFTGDNWNFFGDRQSLLAKLVITYADGRTNVVVTDPLSWQYFGKGPVAYGSFFQGEVYDALREPAVEGWSTASYDASAWKPAHEVALEGHISKAGNPNMPWVNDYSGFELIGQFGQTVKQINELTALSVEEVRPGVFVYDMGQNMVGIQQVKLRGKKDKPITMRFAEVLKDNGTELYLDNLRSALVTDIYTPAADGEFVWEPLFVYHGFRFMEISGLDYEPAADDFTGKVVYDEMATNGTFETSEELINRLHKNAYWGIRGNYRGMPTACPQRDERLGWLGDRTTGAYGESFIFGNALMYKKWLVDIEESMNENGSISVVSPRYWTIFHDDVTWPAAYFYVADMLYRQFGDDSSIKERYPSMKRWVNHMTETKMKDYILVKDEYGDWCMPPESPELIHSEDPARKTNGEVLSTTVFYSILQLMEKFAQMNGLPADAEEYATLAIKVKDAYNKKFFNPETAQYDNNTVTANLLSLRLGLVPDGYEDKVFANVVEKTEKDCKGHVSAGVLGIQHLMRGLTEYGGLELAYKIVTNDTYPSWGYMIKKGATTIWELWNGDTANPAMNSRNHVMLLGDLLIWFYEDLAGIKNAPASVGFKQILMEPVFPEKLNYVNASHVSPYGRIGSSWKRDGNKLKWNVEIPANTTATVKMPLDFHVQVAAGQAGIHSVEEADGKLVVELGSGRYVFMSE